MRPAPNARTRVARLARTLASEPLGFFAALWPLALLAPFVPGLPLPAIASPEWRQEIALAALLFATLLYASRRARLVLTTGRAELYALLPLALFALWGAASALWATGRGASLRYGLTWAAYLLFFALARRAAARPRLLRDSIAALAVVVTIIAAASLVAHESLPDAQIGYNGLGEPLAVATPFFAALALTVRRRKAALACGLTAALAWAAALESAERAAFVSACAGLLVLLLSAAFPSRLKPRSKGRALLLAASFASVFVLMNLPAPTDGGTPSAPAPVLQRLGQTSKGDANTGVRLLLWGTAFEMFREHPLAGVGADNYEVAFPEARARFAERNTNSPLVELNEGFLAQRAHNEYLQMLAELGVFGFTLFALFALALAVAALRALRNSRSPLAPASVSTLVAFALSSGASSVSFRWMGSGLIFFFAAALVSRLGEKVKDARAKSESEREKFEDKHSHALTLSHAASRRVLASGLALASLVLAGMILQAANSLAHGVARGTREPVRAESRFRAALALDPLDAATHFSYGSWLYARGRDAESVEHLQYAVERGFNTSTCYERLAAAQQGAGDLSGAERTLAFAARVYPRSVFVRVRHAVALRRAGRGIEAELEMASALLIDSATANGWRQLIENDIDAAVAASKRNPRNVSMPGDLSPKDAVFAVLEENLRRFPEAATRGWRAQVGSFKPQ